MKTIFNYLRFAVLSAFFACALTSCEKDDNGGGTSTPKEGTGVFILNEGTWGGNNSTISFYDFDLEETDFDITNGELGSGGMDVLIHGSKVYVTVSTSGTIVVLDKVSKEIIKKIEVKGNAGQSREPHYLAFHAGKVYATTFDGNVVRIDTTSLNIDGITPVGANPEGITYANGKLYVANSGGLNYSNIDNTLSVVGINNFQEETRITVGKNPYILKADNNGNIFITCRSIWKPDWSGIETPGCFQYLNTQTKEVTTISDVSALKIAVDGDLCYYYDDSYPANIGVYNTKTKSINKHFIAYESSLAITIPYGIGVDPKTKEVYISETDYVTPDVVHVFDANGKKQRTLDVGIGTCSFAFYR